MTQPLRIVHCFRSPVGGIFRHVRDLAEAQAAAGHQVGIVCDSTTGGAFEERLIEDLKPSLSLGVARTPMQRHIGPRDLVSALRVYAIIKELQPDVLHGHGAKGGVYSRLFGSLLRVFRCRVARVYTAHGGSLHYDERTWTGRLLFTLERGMAHFTDHILFVSEYEREAYRRKVGEPACPSDLVYNGLRLAEFERTAAAPGAADFIYIGMMRDLKGPDLFIDAVAEVETRLGRKVTAVMVGDGADLPRYVAQARALGLADRVSFLQPMPVREALPLAGILVVPSRAEAMPYIVLEALAAGKPTIATAVGGIPEIFGAASGAIVRPDVAALAGRMAEAAAHPDAFSRKMPDAAVLKARFGADVMAGDIERAYYSAYRG